MEAQAQKVQEQHAEDNPLIGVIQEYLDREVPKNWYTFDLQTRRDFLKGDGFEIDMTGAFKRDKICPFEIWCEILNGDVRRFTTTERREIRDALQKIEGWKKKESSEGKAHFGILYGTQRGTYIQNKKLNSTLQGVKWNLTFHFRLILIDCCTSSVILSQNP